MSLRQISGRIADEGGTSAVEFALVLPVLLVILFGVVDLGRIGFINVSLRAASYEGARFSALHPSGTVNDPELITKITSLVRTVASDAESLAGSSLTIPTPVICTAEENDNTSVTVSTTFSWYLWPGLVEIASLGKINLNSFTISSTAVSRCLG